MPRESRDLFEVPGAGPSAQLSPAERPKSELYVCAVCGGPGCFGFGVFLRQDKPGLWACFDHRRDVERMAG